MSEPHQRVVMSTNSSQASSKRTNLKIAHQSRLISMEAQSLRVLKGRILWSVIYVLVFVGVPLISRVNNDVTFLILRQSGTPTLIWATWAIILCCVLLIVIPILLATWVYRGIPVLALIVAVLTYGAFGPVMDEASRGGNVRELLGLLGIILGLFAELLARNISFGKVLLVALVCVLIPAQVIQAPPSTSARSSSLAISGSEKLPISVLWIVADEVSANLVYDAEEYIRKDLKNLRELSETGTTYLRAVTPGTWTTKAIPQMLNGIVSDESEIEDNDLLGIFPLSENSGINAYFYSETIKYPDECGYVELYISGEKCKFGSSYYERSKVLVGDLTATAIKNSVPYFRIKILDNVDLDEFKLGREREASESPLPKFINSQSSNKPFFAFHHYLKTHSPWNLDRNGHEVWKIDDSIPDVTATDENLVGIKQSVRFQHLLRFDDELGAVVAILKQKDLFDSTAIIVTSDHGAILKNLPLTNGRTAERLGDIESTLRDTLHVPLIVKFPNQRTSQRVSELHAPGDVTAWIANQINKTSQEISMSLDSRINRLSTAWGVDVEDPFGKLAALKFRSANVTNPMATRKVLPPNTDLLPAEDVQWFGDSSSSARLTRVRVGFRNTKESIQECGKYELVAGSGRETLGQLFPKSSLENPNYADLWGLAIYDSTAGNVVCVDTHPK